MNEQVIVVTLMSIDMPHSGYADYHVEKVYSEIEKITVDLDKAPRN